MIANGSARSPGEQNCDRDGYHCADWIVLGLEDVHVQSARHEVDEQSEVSDDEPQQSPSRGLAAGSVFHGTSSLVCFDRGGDLFCSNPRVLKAQAFARKVHTRLVLDPLDLVDDGVALGGHVGDAPYTWFDVVLDGSNNELFGAKFRLRANRPLERCVAFLVRSRSKGDPLLEHALRLRQMTKRDRPPANGRRQHIDRRESVPFGSPSEHAVGIGCWSIG